MGTGWGPGGQRWQISSLSRASDQLRSIMKPHPEFCNRFKLAGIGTSAKRSLLRSQLLAPSLVLAQGFEWLA